jgi:hypothetical protein
MKRVQLFLILLLLCAVSFFPPQVSMKDGGSCQKDCKAQFKDDKKKCKSLEDGARGACLENAAAKHQECIKKCNKDKGDG